MSLFVGDLAGYGVDPKEHSVAEAVFDCDGPLPAIYLCCGTDDLLIEQNRALHERLRAAGIEHAWVESPGRHGWAYWRDELPGALRFLGRALQ